MSSQQVLQVGIAVILVMSVLVGCGGSAPTTVSEAPAATSAPEQGAATPTPEPLAATPTPEPPAATPIPPTATPIPPTPTPEPPTATPTPSGPKSGHWEGSEPVVSFDITEDGNIGNFSITISVPSGTSSGTCTIEAENITLKPDGMFDLTHSVKKADFDQNAWNFLYGPGKPMPPVTTTNSVEMAELVRVSGKLDNDTTLTGTFSLWACPTTGGQLFSPASEGTWKAELKGS